MAGHFLLIRNKEQKIFRKLDFLKGFIKGLIENLPDNGKAKAMGLEIIKLPKEFVENPQKEFAFLIGKFTLEEDFGEDNWLAKDCNLECHFIVNNKQIQLKAVYWVV